MSDEEREHAEKFMQYQNKRGGRIVLEPIAKPAKDAWGSGLDALTEALTLEKKVNEDLHLLHDCATKCDDAHLQDFLEENYLAEQVESLKELADLITEAKRAGPGLGEYLFDKHTLHGADK